MVEDSTPSVSNVAAFDDFLASLTTPPATSHLTMCPVDSVPSVWKSSPADPEPPRISSGKSKPPRSSSRALGRSFSAAPGQTSFQAERTVEEVSLQGCDWNEWKERSIYRCQATPHKRCCFRWQFSKYCYFRSVDRTMCIKQRPSGLQTACVLQKGMKWRK